MFDTGWRRRARRWGRRWAALGSVLLGAVAQAQGSNAAQALSTSVEVKLHDVPVKVTASTVLPDAKDPGRYGPANLLDEDPNTIWAEGAESTGAGEWVELSFPPGTPVYAFLVMPGNPKSANLFLANARPKKAKLELKIADAGVLAFDLEFPKNFPAGGAIYVGYHRDWMVESARLTVVSVWPGSKYKDLCLGTFVPVFRGPEQNSLKNFLGKSKALAPTISTILDHPGSIAQFLPPEGSGESAWLRAYAQVPHSGPLSSPELELDLSKSGLSAWGRYRRALARAVAAARVQSDLFRLLPAPDGRGYVLDPVGPPKSQGASNFRIHWRLIGGEWRIVELDLKFMEESPDD